MEQVMKKIFTFLALTVAFSVAQANGLSKPNILFIMADDMNTDLGFNPRSLIKRTVRHPYVALHAIAY
jgi:hypothetical protein